MKTISIALTAMLAGAPQPARACAIKSNSLAVVLGVVGDEVVTVRITLHEGETSADMVKTEWDGTATLEVGARSTNVGTIDPKANASAEVDRLIAAARAKAKQLAGFTPARQVAAKDCSQRPAARCGNVVLEQAGTVLRIGRHRTPLAVALPDLGPEDLELTGVVRYRAGKTELAVVNVGSGDPRFSTSVRTCEGARCRPITTLHHGQQTDVVVVTSKP